MKTVRVLIADDHAMVRAGIRALLEDIAGVVVVAEADTGRRAVDLALEHRPDVVLMDIGMKDLNGLDATAQIKARQCAARVIILSVHDNEAFVRQAMKAGASGYLLKGSPSMELGQAIEAVCAGETFLTPRASTALVEGYVRGEGGEQALTPRQREVLQLIAEGHSSKEIAYRLGLSPKTIDAHRAQIMDRLGIRDVAGLVRYAIRTGLVSSQD